MNRACVVSEFGSRGFNNIFENKLDYCVAYNNTEFIEYVIELLNNEKKNQTLANNGYEKIKMNFSYKIFSDIVKNSLVNCSGKRK